MMTMTFKDFVKQLLYDVTLAGNEGIAAEELERAVRVFAESQRSTQFQQTPTNGTNSVPSDAQASDDALIDEVWNRLENHADITIREPIEPDEPSSATAKDEAPLPTTSKSTPFPPSKHAGKHIFASRSRVCETIAGHSWNFRLLPNKEFDLLSIIAAHGPDGILQPDLRRLAVQDKRSVPKRTDDLAAKGYVSKHKVMVRSQQTSIVKLLKFSTEGMQGPRHVRAFPESTPTSSLRIIYYDVWFDKFLRFLNDNGGIITMQDMRVGLGINGSAWGRKALQRCVKRLVQAGLIRKLNVEVEGETGQNSEDCWMNCIQLIREPKDRDRASFAGAYDSERTTKLKKKFRQPPSRDTAVSDDGFIDDDDEEEEEEDDIPSADEMDDVDDARTDESSSEDEQPTPSPPQTPLNPSLEDRETTTVDRSGNVVSFTVTHTADEPGLEEWGFLRLPSKSTRGARGEQRIFQWNEGDGGELLPISELKHNALSHRKSALLNWTPRKKRHNTEGRVPAAEVDDVSSGSTNGASKRTSDAAALPDAGPPTKLLRVGDGKTASLANVMPTNKGSKTFQKTMMTSSTSTRRTPGVYFNPSDAQELRFMERRVRGRRPKSIVLVFKSDRLRSFGWFKGEVVNEAATINEPQPVIPSVSTKEVENDPPWTGQRRASTTLDLTKTKRGQPRRASVISTQDSSPTTSTGENGTPTKAAPAPAPDSSPYDTAPAFSTRRSRARASQLSPAAPISQRFAKIDLPTNAVSLVSPTVTSTKGADNPTIPSNPDKKRKRGRPSKADIAERERLALEEGTNGKSLIVRLPVTLSPSSERVSKRKKTETPILPIDQDISTPQAMSNDTASASRRNFLVNLSLSPTSLSRFSNEFSANSTRNGSRYVQPGSSLYDAMNMDSLEDEDGGGEPDNSPSKAVKSSLSAPSQTRRRKSKTAIVESEPVLDDSQESTSAKPHSEISVPMPTSITTDEPSPPPAGQSNSNRTVTFESLSESHPQPQQSDGIPTIEGIDRTIQGATSRRPPRRDSAGFARVQGLTVRRTAAGLAVSLADAHSNLNGDSPRKPPATPTPRKTRRRQVSQGEGGAKARRRIETEVIRKSLMMAPAQYIHEPSGTIGTMGVFGYNAIGAESLQTGWKKHHAVPKDLQDILNTPTKPMSGRGKDFDSLPDQFEREVERVRIWEEELVNDGCFVDADVGKVFINHGFDSASTVPVKTSNEVAEFGFVLERFDVPKSKAKVPSTPRRKSTRNRLPSQKAAAVTARNDSPFKSQSASGLAEPDQQSSAIPNQSSTNGSISGLYPGPELPKVPLLPLSRYWTVQASKEALSDAGAIIQSKSASNAPKPDDSGQMMHRAQGRPNSNGGETRMNRSKPSPTNDHHEKTVQSFGNVEPEQDTQHANATITTTPEATSNFYDMPSSEVPLSRLLERLSSGASTTTPSTPIQRSREPSTNVNTTKKRKPSVKKPSKSKATATSRIVDTGNEPVTPETLDREDTLQDALGDLDDSLLERTTPSTSATLRPFPHPQRLCIAILLAEHLCDSAESQPGPNWDVVEHAFVFKYDKLTLQNGWIHQKSVTSGVMKDLENAFKRAFLAAYENDEIPSLNLDHSNDIDKADWPALVRWVEREVLPFVNGYEIDGKGVLGDSTSTGEGSKANAVLHDLDGVFSTDAKGSSIMLNLGSPTNPLYHDLIKARSWVRALVMTEDANYDRERASEKLERLSNDMISRAVTDLEREEMILRKKPGRQVAGRNHRISRFTLLQFARWPENDEHHFLRLVAAARTRIVEHLEQDNAYDINLGLSEADSVVLDSMVEHDHLKRVLDITGIRAHMGNSGLTDIPVFFVKTEKYTSDHGLDCNVKIPSQGSAPFDGAIPFWMDIHGHLLDHIWDMMLRSMLHLLVYQPGVTVKGIKTAHNGQLFSWEIELLLDWMEKTGLAERIPTNNRQDTSVDGGWRASKWWYCAFLPEVARWKHPGGSPGLEELEYAD